VDPTLATNSLAGLVRGDRDEPCADLPGISDRADPAPCDRPSGLHGVARRLGVSADDERDPCHRCVVLGDQAGEGCLVPAGGALDGPL